MLYVLSDSVASDSEAPCTIARQAPLSMGFFREDSGVGCHALLQGIFLTQRLKSQLLCLISSSLLLRHQGSPSPHTRLIFKSVDQWLKLNIILEKTSILEIFEFWNGDWISLIQFQSTLLSF